MKLIEITFSYDEGWQKECKKNGIIKTSISMVNVEHIVSITEWKGQLLHEGRIGTAIATINNGKFVDDRPYNEFMDYLNNI